MSGRHKFSDLEAGMPAQRRARIGRLAKKLKNDTEVARLHLGLHPERAAPETRGDTYRFHIVHDGEVVYCGISVDPGRRLTKHRARWPGATVEIVGPAVPRKTALEWKRGQLSSLSPRSPLRAAMRSGWAG
jgi:hypothetical protein